MAILLMCVAVLAEPVKVCPANPHYLMFKGKPVVLITSDHHYGAVIERDFDFARLGGKQSSAGDQGTWHIRCDNVWFSSLLANKSFAKSVF